MIGRRFLLLVYVLLMSLGLLLIVGAVMAQEGEETPPPATPLPAASRMHPSFALLDAEGKNVLESGQALSTMQTCGQCHDTGFIVEHSQHSLVAPNAPSNWNPVTYQYVTAADDPNPDLSLEQWVKQFGARHVGGGENPLVEMNCFLCHTAIPNTEARSTALSEGNFAWANSVTLLGTGILQEGDGGLAWNPDAFDTEGLLKHDFITIQDPTSQNCAACHGTVHMDNQVPLETATCDKSQWTTFTTGQIFAPQRMANSALNLADKENLSRSWDVHAERMVTCVDCHYALNNPTYYKTVADDQPEHLIFDPRRLDISEYLYRPLHDFANGEVLSEAGAVVHNDTAQPCEACHTLADTHEWLPYKDRHTEVLACESCHIPQMNAPALQSVDWTVLNTDSSPNLTCRGVENSGLIDGYQPVLLARQVSDEQKLLAPYNLVSAWYWAYGDDKRPVPLANLQAAWLEGDTYPAEVLTLFDANQDGALDENELLIDNNEKESFIQNRLETQGLTNVHIEGEVLPYNLNHGVAEGEWAIKECDACHSDNSRVNQALVLADNMPGGVKPTFQGDGEVSPNGDFVDDDGALLYQPTSAEADLYVLGHDNVDWISWLGILFFLGTFVGVIIHGGLRVFSARQHANAHHAETQQLYMYSVYERQWHWLQTVVIFLLIFTGLIIHKPDLFGMFSFRYVVQVHNISAVILLINAALAAFYHLASGEIRQFMPRPYGFFDQAFMQAKFYLWGIFRNDPHPFEKTPERKLNPIQQMTYLVLLNVLLPLQILTGALMWGQQRFPDLSQALGGLPYLAPVHTLVAWALASFIVLHVYMTTTGHEPLSNIKAMMLGWDEVETLEHEKGLSS